LAQVVGLDPSGTMVELVEFGEFGFEQRSYLAAALLRALV